MIKKKTAGATKKPVLIRAYSGVFFGYLVAKTATDVTIERSRHIWSWTSNGLPRKAMTVDDVAMLGIGTGSKISGVTASQILADWKQIVDASPDAVRIIEAMPCQ